MSESYRRLARAGQTTADKRRRKPGKSSRIDRSFGAVAWSNDRLHPMFTCQFKREGFQRIAPGLVPVKRGTRRNFVRTDDIIGLSIQVNESRKGMADQTEL